MRLVKLEALSYRPLGNSIERVAVASVWINPEHVCSIVDTSCFDDPEDFRDPSLPSPHAVVEMTSGTKHTIRGSVESVISSLYGEV
jgi:hypothetical protein